MLTKKGNKDMIKTTVRIDGMMCGMCESHVNDAIRREFSVKKVTSSHKKGETVVISSVSLDEQKLRSAIEAMGYKLLSIGKEPYEKKSLFSFLKK